MSLTGEVAMKECSIRNKRHLLAHKPRNAGIIYEDKKTKFGWWQMIRQIQYNNYLIHWTTNYADRIALLRPIDESARFPKGNLDLIDAVLIMREIFDADFTWAKEEIRIGETVHLDRVYLPGRTGRLLKNG